MENIRKKDDITCIQLSKRTRDMLAEMGGKKDTYEDIIKGLIDFKNPMERCRSSRYSLKKEDKG